MKFSRFNLRKNVCLIALFTLLTACSQTPNTVSMTQVDHADLAGTWVIEYIEQIPVIDHSPARLEFSGNGRLSGSASCNRMMSAYTLRFENNESLLSFGQTAGTMMMCPDVLMDQEGRVLAALPKVKKVFIEKGLLYLTDENNVEIFTASKESK